MKKRNKNDEVRWSTLMTNAQRGNENDYRQLLSELGDTIAAYLRSRFGDLDVLEDCVQESLMAIHKARDTYETSRLFRPWLFAIVNHKTIDMLRKRDKHHNVINEKMFQQKELMSIEADHLVDRENKFDKMQSCGQLLMSLPDIHREAILLTKLQGLSMKEAAEHLEISEGAMKVRVHRALDASRKLLKSERY
ncbi:MAG: RNA polymerase sigma-70 factor (ECF subfamily) [Cellvibrionaceae bacterium]|jgi:RNA polymerase sigma-70 factor (ECF subfamily)